jgi:RHS repeat-associated protein
MGFYFDSGVKSYDMQAREYRPDSGRFLSQDRYESAAADQTLQADPLTQNRYAFAGGNPVNNVEFDGHRLYNPDGGRQAPRQPRRGGGPNGDNSPPSTADGSASRSRPQGRIALPVVPRTTRVSDRRALTLSRTHPLQALYADGPSDPPLLQPAAKKLAHAAGSVLNTAGDIANWPFPKTTVGNALHGTGADLQSGNPARILLDAASLIPIGRGAA